MGFRAMTLLAALAAMSLGHAASAADGDKPSSPRPGASGDAPAVDMPGERESASGASDGLSKARLEYGAYLTLAGDCVACHTRPDGQPFEGGRALETPFGTIYTPNITPSKRRGIGDFSDEDFLRALHRGIGPDGKPYYPAFPYTSYTKVSADDVLAIKDYLFSLQPSDYRPPETELRWPFDVRDLLFGWQALYFAAGRFEPDPDKGEAWNRGAYLVEGLGHCGECHTPRNLAGASEPSEVLDGAVIDGWFAPNLTSDLNQGIGEWSVEALATYLRTGLDEPGDADDAPRTAAIGPMAEVVHDSLSKLALSDLRAIAVYLKDMPAAEAPAPRPSAAAEAPQPGGTLYQRYCSGCHQRYGQGIAPYFPALRGNPAVTLEQPDDVVEAILLGAPADPAEAYSEHVVMPSFGSILNDEEIAAVASFIRASWGNAAAPVAPDIVRELRKEP
jgi:mono/diheme cytochrome c family protein